MLANEQYKIKQKSTLRSRSTEKRLNIDSLLSHISRRRVLIRSNDIS